MDVYFQLVTDAETVKTACEKLSADETLGFDTETTELDPYDGDLRLVQFSSGKGSVIFDLMPFRKGGDLKNDPALAPLRDLIASEKHTKIAHNAKFDAKWVRHHLGCELGGIFDTYLASQLIAAGETDRRHSLADVAQFFTGTELDKSQQVSDWASPELSQSQLEYAARDAAVLLPLHKQMVDRLEADGLKRVAELEFETVVPVAEMELNGFFLDRDRWSERLSEVKAHQAKAAEELQDLLAAGVAQATLFGRMELNLDSPSQVNAALVNLGVPIGEGTRAWQLQPLAEKYQVVAKLLEYRQVQKAVSSFGDNILEFIRSDTGRVHADFRQIGAPTGRFSCSNPNLQQIPHEAEYRRCFRAPEGRKLVVADYSQIELRILAEFSEDAAFIEAFVSGQDFHTMTAAQVFKVKPEDVTSEQRSFAKRLNFGIVYGVGASRFGLMTGLSQTEAENTMRKYFSTYRRLDEYLRTSASDVIEHRVARTASGRMLKLRFDAANRQEVGAARRYGVNMPIQGTSADILKRSLRLLHEDLRTTSGRLVNIVHDEVIVECDAGEADAIAATLESAMVRGGEEYVQKVPVKVDVAISDEWTK